MWMVSHLTELSCNTIFWGKRGGRYFLYEHFCIVTQLVYLESCTVTFWLSVMGRGSLFYHPHWGFLKGCHPFFYPTFFSFAIESYLSSPRAENARAFTGRRNSHSGRGEDFLTGQPDFFTETAVTPERKVKKSFPMWEINRHAEG